jgi:hypothetical protein
MIEKGVIFEGQCKMENLDRGSLPKSASSSPTPTPISALQP